jgi:phosphoribosyl-ATP pyrophosphohydrolase
MTPEPLGDASLISQTLADLARTIDARAGADPATSWTARLLAGGPGLAAKKLGEEGVEAALAVAAQSDADVAGEAADLIYHLMVALRSRGISLDQVAGVLADRTGRSGVEEKASRS